MIRKRAHLPQPKFAASTPRVPMAKGPHRHQRAAKTMWACLVAHHAFIPNPAPDRVEQDQPINRIWWPRPPSGDFTEHGIRHSSDQFRRRANAPQIAQMPDYLACAHVSGVHRNDFIAELEELPLVFGDQLRIKAGLPITRHIRPLPTDPDLHDLAGMQGRIMENPNESRIAPDALQIIDIAVRAHHRAAGAKGNSTA